MRELKARRPPAGPPVAPSVASQYIAIGVGFAAPVKGAGRGREGGVPRGLGGGGRWGRG